MNRAAPLLAAGRAAAMGDLVDIVRAWRGWRGWRAEHLVAVNAGRAMPPPARLPSLPCRP